MLVNKILSTSLATGIATWFKTNFNYQKDGETAYYILPGNIYDCAMANIPTNELPALSIWTTKDNTKSDTWHEIGLIHMDVMFNTYNEYAYLSKQFNETLSAIRAQLLTNPVYIMNYLQGFTPGLLQLATTTETDMSKYRDALARKESSYIHTFQLTYKINIFLNQKAIWDEGYDYFSPAEIIYEQNEAIDTEITILKKEVDNG